MPRPLKRVRQGRRFHYAIPWRTVASFAKRRFRDPVDITKRREQVASAIILEQSNRVFAGFACFPASNCKECYRRHWKAYAEEGADDMIEEGNIEWEMRR